MAQRRIKQGSILQPQTGVILNEENGIRRKRERHEGTTSESNDSRPHLLFAFAVLTQSSLPCGSDLDFCSIA